MSNLREAADSGCSVDERLLQLPVLGAASSGAVRLFLVDDAHMQTRIKYRYLQLAVQASVENTALCIKHKQHELSHSVPCSG